MGVCQYFIMEAPMGVCHYFKPNSIGHGEQMGTVQYWRDVFKLLSACENSSCCMFGGTLVGNIDSQGVYKEWSYRSQTWTVHKYVGPSQMPQL